MSHLPTPPGPTPTGPPPTTEATVAICAYTERRWDDLQRGVSAARRQQPAEVLVVIDHNETLLHRAREAWTDQDGAPVRVVANHRTRGASGSRNAALDLVTTPLVAFLDDDACPQPGWLDGLLAPYAEPDVVAVGGGSDPWWDTARGSRPPHLAPELDWVVGSSFIGQADRLSEVRNLMGCTMSFRHDVLVAIGGFAEEAGRVGTIPVGCEETEACIQVRRQVPGSRIMLNPASRVRHRVTEDRVTWRYLRDRCVAEGLSKAWVAGRVGSGEATSDERGYALRVLPAGVLRELRRVLRGDRQGLSAAAGLVLALCWAAQGYLQGRLGLGGKDLDRAKATRSRQGSEAHG